VIVKIVKNQSKSFFKSVNSFVLQILIFNLIKILKKKCNSMKTKTKKGILYLGVAFLLCLNGLISYIPIENTVLETDIQDKNLPRLSSQYINIITPENKTYIGAMEGYYPATYGFENETLGSDPIEWLCIRSGGTVRIVEEVGTHKNVAKIRDIDNSGYVSFLNQFDSNKVSGTVEFWVSTNDTSKAFYMRILASISERAVIMRIENDYIYCQDSTTWRVVKSISNNKWYHFSIEFDCSTDTYNCWIDGNLEAADYGFGDGDISSVSKLQLYTTNIEADYEVYVDAVGYSWDTNYNIGDNLNEGLLLSFTNNTKLDWIGYSLDGQSTKTIYGNTSIPTPNDGLHSIQLFGNDSLGTGYHSDKRWFKVEAFSNNYIEDFTTTTYMDDLATNSSGWGSGALNLPNKNLTVNVFEAPSNWRSSKVQMSGDIVYSANYYRFEIHDISNPSEPILLSAYSDGCYDFVISGNYAYIAAYRHGLIILDISDKSNPSLLGSCDNYQTHSSITDLYATTIEIKGAYAYIWDLIHELIVINIANPSNPFKAGDWLESGGFYGEKMIIKDNYLYLLTGNVIIFDISSPTSPSDVYTYNTGTYYDTGVISGNYLYLPGQYTLDILNIVTPTAPAFVSSTHTGVSGPQSIAFDNYFVYIGGNRIASPNNYGLVEIYDVSNVVNPQFEYRYISPCADPSHSSMIDTIDVINGFSFMTDYYGYYIIADFNLIDQYEAIAIGQSSSIYSGTSNVLLTHVLLEVSEDIPTDTGITYYVSADNGSHWEQIIPNSVHAFEYLGNQLKWKAVLTTSHLYRTPQLNSLSIAYLPLLNGTILLTPLNHTHTNDNTPYFEWGDIPEATDYIIQLDTSTTFNSVDYRYQKVNNNYWTASPFLQDNTWYWRVAGIDSKNDVGFFSAYNILYIDAPPGQSTLISPENNRYIATSNPTFTWSEAYNALNYTLQLDSSNTFSSGDLIIYSQILLTSYSPISPITDGIWYWRIQAFDNTGNSGPYSNVNLIIIDATIPSIDQPNDKSYKEGSTGNRIVWNSNDINPDRCEVTRDETIVRDNSWDGNIIIIDIDELSVGTYIYTCTVYDKAGNSNSDIVTVTVEEAENIFGPFINVYITLGVIGVVAIPVVYFVLKKFKNRP